MEAGDNVDCDDTDTRHSSAQKQGMALFNVVSQLYCLSIAADFRRPVEVLYPNIAASYLSVIKHPMDLGTLLLECMRGTATMKNIRKGLRLVFSNSLRFNAGSPMMEAISQHLETFACGLFEEGLESPFHDEKLSNCHDFRSERIRQRHHRLQSVRGMPLQEAEVQVVEHSLMSMKNVLPAEMSEPLRKMMITLQNYSSKISSQEPDCNVTPILTLEMIFKPFITAAKSLSGNSNKAHRVVPGENAPGESVPAENILPALVTLVGIPIEIADGTSTQVSGDSISPPIKTSSSLESSSLVTEEHSATTPSFSANNHDNVDGSNCISSNHEDNSGNCNDNNNMSDSNDNNDSDKPTQAGTIHSANTRSPSLPPGKSEELFHKTQNGTTINPLCLPYVRALDEALGTLLVALEERLVRGTNHSSVWQRPLALMWAQPTKVPRK